MNPENFDWIEFIVMGIFLIALFGSGLIAGAIALGKI